MLKDANRVLSRRGTLLQGNLNNVDKVELEKLEGYRNVFVSMHQKWFPHCNTAQLSDAYSEAIIIFYTNLQNGKVKELKASPGTYVFAVAKKILLNENRKERRYETLEFEVSTEQDEVERERKVEEHHKEEFIYECIDSLGPRAKQMLTLLLLEGKSIREVAKIMNFSSTRSASTAKHKFIVKLKRLVAKRFKEWERNERET